MQSPRKETTMKSTRLKTLAAILLFAATLALSGCGGGGAEVRADSNTTGQELLDLKKAYEAGAISEDEYEEQREKILDRD
jgi:uncharacterized membrane protein